MRMNEYKLGEHTKRRRRFESIVYHEKLYWGLPKIDQKENCAEPS